ncbi:MAG: GNAT family N-acetyltransferase [archaeon]
MPKTRAWSSRRLFYERKIYGIGKPITQRAYFSPSSREISLELFRGPKRKELVGEFNSSVQTTAKGKIARINWVNVRSDMRKKGLFFQMLSEALALMKKRGIKRVDAHVSGGDSSYLKQGFKIGKKDLGGIWYYKDL